MIELTAQAADRLQRVLAEQGKAPATGLRVFVKGGGCGGLQYGMTLEDTERPGDTQAEQHGLAVYVDMMSLPHLQGARIDYADSLMGGGFHIENPNAVSTCGCGSSFRTAGSETGDEGSCGG